MSDDPTTKFHEVWWIYSPERHEWGGLRIARFMKTSDGQMIVFIIGEGSMMRLGPRMWDYASEREGWVKVAQIHRPTEMQILVAQDAALRGIAERITAEVFGGG